MQTTEEVLQACTIEGNIVRLPDVELDRKLYTDVKKILGKIGGVWKGHQTQGFVFEQDPTDLLTEIAAGTKRNLKKEFQFFETGPELADRVVQLANIDRPDLVLGEPSAGRGALVKAVRRVHPSAIVHCYELQELNRTFLMKVPGVVLLGNDFMEAKPTSMFDRLVANPPFSKNQDIEHVFRMYCCLKDGGRVVSIVSRHWQLADGKKELEFKKWLKLVPHQQIDLDAGEFKSSGTNVLTSILIIDKRIAW
jgi:hypothetical protein